ncbi:hypothetical protein [Brevibacillus sp. H7]|uniref:hypothetical protein n=1 Tax=Brevibacillus sp. H7 TaxID=3349138 RepID=UPI00381A2B86
MSQKEKKLQNTFVNGLIGIALIFVVGLVVNSFTEQTAAPTTEETQPIQEPENKPAKELTQEQRKQLYTRLASLHDELSKSYQLHQKSYNSDQWDKFSDEWNNRLKKLQTEFGLDSNTFTGTDFLLAVTPSDLFLLWAEYDALLAGRKKDDSDMKTFKNSIYQNLNRAKELIN